MRKLPIALIFLFAAVLAVSCRSHKESSLKERQYEDSLALNTTFESILAFDSLRRNRFFDFDTLQVSREFVDAECNTLERLTLRAIKGSIRENLAEEKRNEQTGSHGNVQMSKRSRQTDTEKRIKTQTNRIGALPVMILMVIVAGMLYWLYKRW